MNFIILGCIMLKRKAVTSIKNWINIKNVLLYRAPDKLEKRILLK